MKDFWRLFKKDGVFILVIIFILLLFFNKIIFRNHIYITGDFLRSDTLNQNLPFKYNLYQSLRKGQLPLWTNKIFNGFPLLAEGQTGTFYPFNLIPFLLFPFTTAYNLLIFLNFVLAALGMFFLARSFGLRSFSSLIAAISFTLSSFFVLHITHHNIVSAAVWLPFLVLSFKKLFETEKIRYLIFTSAIIAFTIFVGSFQIIFYMLFLTFIFFLTDSLNHSHDSIPDGRHQQYQQSQQTRRKRVAKFIILYLLTIFLGLLLSSVQLFPTLELIRNSTRQAGLGNVALDSLPYHPRNLITFIFPYIFGDPGSGTYPHFGGSWGMFWENTAYVGLITLVLAFLSILSKVRPQKRTDLILRFLFLISILLALGKYGPLFWIYYLPGFNLFRVTARFLLFVVFSLSLLAGFGLELVCQKVKNFYLKMMVNLFVFLILLIDLFLFGYNYNPTGKAELILEKPPAAKFLEKQLGKGERIFSVADFLTYDEINKNGWRNNLQENLNHKNSLGPNINMLWGIENSDGYAGLFLRRNEIFKNLIYQGMKINPVRKVTQGIKSHVREIRNNLTADYGALSNGVNEDKIEVSPNSLKLLGLANVRYLISAFDLQGDGLEKITELGEGIKYKIYENRLFLPKGKLYQSYLSTDKTAVFNYLGSEKFDPQDQLFLEAWLLNEKLDRTNEDNREEKIVVQEEKDGYYQYQININSPKIFLLQETYYPSWTAYVNGKETPIYPADGMFMAVQVPKGKSVAKFVYQPMSFYLGAFISGLSILAVVGFGIYRMVSHLTTAVSK